MAKSQLLTLQLSDLINWFRDKQLVINDEFQRRAVWTKPAKSFLIDTILQGLPIPKIYIRTKVDPLTQRSIREVVDGQQRIRTLVEFANNELRLTSRSIEFSGLTYNDLSDEQKEGFLGYVVGVEQLLNADNVAVLEVFARLNSYTVVLNDAEKRHAGFQTEFKWQVRRTAQEWGTFFETSKIISLRQRFRMLDDEFVAELYRVLIEGVCDGGAPKLRKLYKEQSDTNFTEETAKRTKKRIDESLSFLQSKIGDAIRDELAKPHQVLMMFAAYCHHKYGISKGDLERLPNRRSIAQPSIIRNRLAELLDALQTNSPPPNLHDYVLLTRKTSPQRIASRKLRFKEMVRVIGE